MYLNETYVYAYGGSMGIIETEVYSTKIQASRKDN